MAKIKVDVGVYLPSNPDGIVIDIDKRSGRPLQSHAKVGESSQVARNESLTRYQAPFMATFKVRKERLVITENPDSVLETEAPANQDGEQHAYEDIWQSAIFKVGDDCRQDVLALQVIAMFKNIFMRVGLPLYLMPYRVIATAPGVSQLGNFINRHVLTIKVVWSHRCCT
jgi:phosphatidylinositol 4-kinase A